MNRCYAFSRRRFIWCPPHHLIIEDLLIQLLRRYTPTVRRFIRCWRPRGQNVSGGFHVTSDRPTLPLDQGVSSSGAEDFVLARLCLDSNWASDRPTMSSLRPSDHPVLLSSLLFLCNSSDASTKWTVSSSDGANFIFPPAQCTNYTDAMHRWYRRFIRQCLFPSFSSCLQLGSLLELNILNILKMPLLKASKYILSPQFCCK
jgi:hypothetical protein